MINRDDGWSILIVDDESIIHDVLSMNLRDMQFDGKGVNLVSTFSATEAKNIISTNPHIAVVILDVMMEKDDAGLDLVRYIREEHNNADIRILLHTGQPGIAPKKHVADSYGIDAYLDKNISDNEDCYVAVKLALKSYRDCLKLKKVAAKKDDVSLMEDIADGYIDLLADKALNHNYDTLFHKINKIVHLVQEILAGYALNDVKNDLCLGSTKETRLSYCDYALLIRISDIKVILSHSPIEHYKKDWNINFDMLLQSARGFCKIGILPDTSKKLLQKHIRALEAT